MTRSELIRPDFDLGSKPVIWDWHYAWPWTLPRTWEGKIKIQKVVRYNFVLKRSWSTKPGLEVSAFWKANIRNMAKFSVAVKFAVTNETPDECMKYSNSPKETSGECVKYLADATLLLLMLTLIIFHTFFSVSIADFENVFVFWVVWNE